jgi:hypothetical protein
MLVMPDDFAAAAQGLRALLAVDSAPDVVDDFIDLLERLPIASKEACEWGKAVTDVGIATIRYKIALARVPQKAPGRLFGLERPGFHAKPSLPHRALSSIGN